MEGEALQQVKKSFREAKVEQLREERGAPREDIDPVKPEPKKPQPEKARAERLPEDDEDSDYVDDDVEDESEAPLDAEEPDDDVGSPEDDEADEDDGIDYRKKYAELEKQYSKVTANRKAIESELGTAHEKVTRLSHEVQDTFEQAKQSAEFFANIADNQLRQLQQVNPAMLSPEQQGQYYAQLNHATQHSQQMRHALHETMRFANEAKTKKQKRDAEVSVSILKARIPEWGNEVYAELGKTAADYGFTQEEFGEITDHRMMLLLYELLKTRKTADSVKKSVKQRKTNPPKSRSGRPMERNTRGQFEKAKRDFKPNQRGSFAEVAKARLRMEREGR